MNHGRFRACYESALRQNPSVSGRAALRFQIGRSGLVSYASGESDDLPKELVSCLARNLYSLTFPQPDGGVVSVSYPLRLKPEAVIRRTPMHGYRYVTSPIR